MISDMNQNCPTCGCKALKVIYFGMPMTLCEDERCSTLWGFWSWLPLIWFNGIFTSYEGSYWTALWYWLKGE